MTASTENVTIELFEDIYNCISDEARAEVDSILRQIITGMKSRGDDSFEIFQAKILFFQLWDFLNLEPATQAQLSRQAKRESR